MSGYPTPTIWIRYRRVDGALASVSAGGGEPEIPIDISGDDRHRMTDERAADIARSIVLALS